MAAGPRELPVRPGRVGGEHAVGWSLAPFGRAFPGLAPAPAPAGTGRVNDYNDIGPLTVVLRSWERRYAAVLVGLGSDTLTLAVRRPPRTGTEALALAAEHFAACADQVWQGTDTIANYAAMLRGREAWRFWWD